MSALTQLYLSQFRNLTTQTLSFNSGMNCFIGANGSGKTSIIEAIHHLSIARSFRAHLLSDVVQYGRDAYVLSATFNDNSTRAIKKGLKAKPVIKFNGELVRAYELACSLPSILIYQNLYQIIDAPAIHRRNLLNWGVFHVKHDYLSLLSAYNKSLKQRNALLKNIPIDTKQLEFWDEQLISLGFALTQARQLYLSDLKPVFTEMLQRLSNLAIDIDFQSGFGTIETLEDCRAQLLKSYDRDIKYGQTHVGAHKFDLSIKQMNKKAKVSLSRGEQKISVIALKFAQAELLNTPCLFLIDDLQAELDDVHMCNVLEYLGTDQKQVFLSAINTPSKLDAKMFHVKHGEVI